MCGEYAVLIRFVCSVMGSPPRVRGIQETLIKIAVACRITPACAGNTVYLYLFLLSARDHPRVCGEYATTPSSPGR